MPFTDWSTGDVITATKLDNDNTVAVGTDTARTISVTHTWTASQTLTGGFSFAAASTGTSTLVLTVASATAFAVGRQGSTDPVFLVHSSTASQATGISVTGAAAAGGVAVAAISSGTNEALTIDAKGSGQISLGTNSTGQINLLRQTKVANQLIKDNRIEEHTTDAETGLLLNYHGYNDGTTRFRNVIVYDGKETQVAKFNGQTRYLELVGSLFVGSVTTNAKNTLGATIHQAGNDDEILSLKSSDVAHGMTTPTETDTYGSFGKVVAASGGLQVRGFTEATRAFHINASATTEDATRSTSADGAAYINCDLKSVATVGNMSANQNMLVVANNGTVRFIFDTDGDSHQDVGTAWTNFDTHDDVALLNLLAAHVTRPSDPLRESFGEWLAQNRGELERVKLVTFNDDGHHFVNMSRLTMLHTGALRQLGAQLDDARTALRLALDGDRDGALALIGA